MSKEIRMNASPENSDNIRSIKAQYDNLHRPGRVSLEALANTAMAIGIPILRKQVQTPKPTKPK